jgi:hypothetical protein
LQPEAAKGFEHDSRRFNGWGVGFRMNAIAVGEQRVSA